MMQQEVDPEQEAKIRKALPFMPGDVVVDCLLRVQALLTMRQATSGLGLHDEMRETDQAYRLTLYTAKQELLRRLTPR
jgi:hypothetical protein